jgi:phosphatidylglycerophosphate synthase
VKKLNDIQEHERVNDTLLDPLERPALEWLAAHLPPWMTPDGCTLIGAIGALVIFSGYALSTFNRDFLWLATFGFLVNWFGDSLDGTLARHRHIERPVYGFFIDHTMDAFNEVLIFLGLGLSPYISFSAACLVLIGYLLLSVLVYVRTCVAGEFKISYSKLGPTEFRMAAMLLNVGMYFGGRHVVSVAAGAFGRLTFSIYDLLVIVCTLLLLYFFIVTAAKETIRLAKENK